jgi:hydrogenase maturation protein HypF
MKNKTILATGADIKSRFLLAKGKDLRFGPDISDLSNAENYELFKREVSKAARKAKPKIIACDLHPDYFSTKFAKEFSGSVKPVQHHHAHIASVMQEYCLKGPVIGVSFDGTGYGTDGNTWGGEFLLAKARRFERLAHLKYRKMPGGDKVVREPWRMVLSILGKEGADLLKDVPKRNKDLVLAMMERDINSPLTSSAGRLFDAAAALLGICVYASMEAEGPIKLESMCRENVRESYKFEVEKQNDTYVIDAKGLFQGMIKDMKEKRAKELIATKFHNSMAKIVVRTVKKLSKNLNIKDIALSGGVFQNNFLKKKVLRKLKKSEFNVYINSSFPVNDLNISLGQYYVLSGACKS